MGDYDYLHIPGKDIGTLAQVKLWGCEHHVYLIGDAVPAFFVPDYSIALREGGYANIIGGKYFSHSSSPRKDFVVDKFGDVFDEENFTGLSGEKEKYFFSPKS